MSGKCPSRERLLDSAKAREGSGLIGSRVNGSILAIVWGCRFSHVDSLTARRHSVVDSGTATAVIVGQGPPARPDRPRPPLDGASVPSSSLVRASVSDTLVFKRRPPTSFWKGLWLCTTYDITLAQEEIAIWALARNWAPPKATPRATHVPVASDDERHRLKVPKVRSAASRREAARPQEEKIQSKAIHQSSNRPKRRRRDGVTTRSRAVRSPHHSARLEREETLQTGRDAESRRFPRRRSR